MCVSVYGRKIIQANLLSTQLRLLCNFSSLQVMFLSSDVTRLSLSQQHYPVPSVRRTDRCFWCIFSVLQSECYEAGGRHFDIKNAGDGCEMISVFLCCDCSRRKKNNNSKGNPLRNFQFQPTIGGEEEIKAPKSSGLWAVWRRPPQPYLMK
jgi:hypothetical protein